jgi:hypothetical protein
VTIRAALVLGQSRAARARRPALAGGAAAAPPGEVSPATPTPPAAAPVVRAVLGGGPPPPTRPGGTGPGPGPRATPDRGLAPAGQVEAGVVEGDEQPVGDEPRMPRGRATGDGCGRRGGRPLAAGLAEQRRITLRRATTHPSPC